MVCVSVDVDVEVDPADVIDELSEEELAEHGLHTEDSCPYTGNLPGLRQEARDAVIDALHQQAHPDQPLAAMRCLHEPCRSLPGRSGTSG